MTVAAVAVIFLVPVLNECRGRDGDVFACLRQQAAELVPSADAPPAGQPSAETPADPVAPEPDDQAPIALRPEVEALNVSPDGTIVITGSGPPGADIPVYADGELFGTVTAAPDGGWTLAADKPLPPGGTAIVVGDIGGEEVAEQGFVVVVDPAQQADPQVFEGAPDELASLLLDAAPPLSELPPGGDPVPTETAEAPPDAVPPDQTGAIIVGQATDVAATEPSETEGETTPDAAKRAAEDVAEALADPRDVAPVPALTDPATTTEAAPDAASDAATNAVSVAAERAAREVAEALASPRDVAPVIPAQPVESVESTVVVPSAAARAALEVTAALANPRDVALQPETALEPQEEVPADNVLPSAAERAAHEVRQALARQRDVAPLPIVETVGETPEPRPTAAERAADEVAAALNDPRDVLPLAVSTAAPTESAEEVPTSPAQDIAADALSPAAERAAREVREALNRQREVAPVPVAEPAPTAEDVADNEVTSGNAAERAAQEAATALANPQDVAPIAEPAPQVVSPVERARLEVLAAIEAAARRMAELPVAEDATAPATPPDVLPSEPDGENPTVDLGASEALAAIEAALNPPEDVPAPLTPEPPVEEPVVEEPALGAGPADDAAAPAPSAKPPVEGLILPARPEPRTSTTSEVETAAPPVPADVADRPPTTVAAPPLPKVDPRPAPDVQLTLVDPAELARSAPGTYVVRHGDTLWDISRRVYGEGHRYRTIYRANREVIRHPGRIQPGQVLEIPLVYD